MYKTIPDLKSSQVITVYRHVSDTGKFTKTIIISILFVLCFLELSGFGAAILFLIIAFTLCLPLSRGENIASPVIFVTVAYLFSYPFPMMFHELYPSLWGKVPGHAIEYGMLWALRGFGAFSLGYMLVMQLVAKRSMRINTNQAMTVPPLHYARYVVSAIGWLALLSMLTRMVFFGTALTFIEGSSAAVDSSAGSLVQVLTLLTNLRYAFFCGYIILRYFNQETRKLKSVLLILLGLCIVEIIIIGSKGAIIRLLVAFLLPLTILPFRLSFKKILLLFTATALVYGSFSTITEYRSLMHSSRISGENVFSFSVQSEAFVTALLRSISFAGNEEVKRSNIGSEQVLSRFGSGMFSFANIIEFTGRDSPYENALESFFLPAYALLPRFIVTNKPVFFGSGTNAKRYYRWSYGGISVSLFGSFYYAWGYEGVIFGMAFMGSLFGFLVRSVKDAGILSVHKLILFVMLTIALLDVGVEFQSIVVNFIRATFLLYLLRLSYHLIGKYVRHASHFRTPLQQTKLV